jgi:hypothetical protein
MFFFFVPRAISNHHHIHTEVEGIMIFSNIIMLLK